MGKRNRERGTRDQTDWSIERTMADAEADEAESTLEASPVGVHEGHHRHLPEIGEEHTDLSLPRLSSESGDPRQEPSARIAGETHQAQCACGSEEFLLEAFIAIVRGRMQPEPVEMESLTCPNCGREYEAIWLANGQIARGEFRGQTNLDDE